MKKLLLAPLAALLGCAGLAQAQTSATVQYLPQPTVDPKVVVTYPVPTYPQPATPVVAAVEPAPVATYAGEGYEVLTGYEKRITSPYFRANVEYLNWRIKEAPLPVPLVTSDPLNISGGILGQPGTNVLFGGSGLDFDRQDGLRVNAALGLNCDSTVTLEASGSWLERATIDFLAQSDANGSPLLATPFFAASFDTPGEASFAVSAPGLVSGAVGVQANSRLWGAEANVALGLVRKCNFNLDFLLGTRYLSLQEDLAVSRTSTALQDGVIGVGPTVAVTGDVLRVNDRFDCDNQFFGGQLGLRTEYRRGWFFINATGKVALGRTREILGINGTSSLENVTNGTATVAGGLYAQPSNIGTTTSERFSVVPEAIVSSGIDIGGYLRIYGGYNYLYWTDVIRPGDQVDRNVNINLAPTSPTFGTPGGPFQPTRPMARSDFWAEGFFGGIELRF